MSKRVMYIQGVLTQYLLGDYISSIVAILNFQGFMYYRYQFYNAIHNNNIIIIHCQMYTFGLALALLYKLNIMLTLTDVD